MTTSKWTWSTLTDRVDNSGVDVPRRPPQQNCTASTIYHESPTSTTLRYSNNSQTCWQRLESKAKAKDVTFKAKDKAKELPLKAWTKDHNVFKDNQRPGQPRTKAKYTTSLTLRVGLPSTRAVGREDPQDQGQDQGLSLQGQGQGLATQAKARTKDHNVSLSTTKDLCQGQHPCYMDDSSNVWK